MGRPHQIQDQKAGIVDKLHALDFMMDSLGKMDAGQGDAVDEMVKKISTRKLLLMDELFKLLSHLSIT